MLNLDLFEVVVYPLGAKRLGIKTILLRWNDNYAENLDTEDEVPDYVVKSLMEIPEIMR